jgi:hypothetical protein
MAKIKLNVPIKENSITENNARVEESLSEIYQDEKGNSVNVQEIIPKRKFGIIFWLPFSFFLITLVLSAGWYYFSRYAGQSNSSEIELSITPSADSANDGENFTWTINYANISRVALKNIDLTIALPPQFSVNEFKPVPAIASSSTNNLWHFDRLEGYEGGKIAITGRFFGKTGERAIINAEMAYTPENFSSEFKKSAVSEALIKGTGIAFTFDNYTSAIVGSENEAIVRYKTFEGSRISDFQLEVNSSDNSSIGFISKASTTNGDVEHSSIKPNLWIVKNATTSEKELPVYFLVSQKRTDSMDLDFIFSYTDEKGNQFVIEEKKLSYALLENNLNVNLVVNGSKDDQGVNFSQPLNYSIYYINKGDAAIGDVILQAVIEGGLVGWDSLKDENKGRLSGNTLTWTKEELPALAMIEPNAEGTIDFSVPVLSREAAAGRSSDAIKSYVQFKIGSSTEDQKDGNLSNTIINKINSDMAFTERVRYFNEDNIAVGSGPLPPKVGETSSFKVYWTMLTSIHELENARVETVLPSYVSWGGKELTTVGTISYKEDTRTVSWEIGKLPVMPETINAEFSVSITPVEEDRNKIMVILSDTDAKAADTATAAELIKTVKPETTKLEGDEIGRNDGRVQ